MLPMVRILCSGLSCLAGPGSPPEERASLVSHCDRISIPTISGFSATHERFYDVRLRSIFVRGVGILGSVLLVLLSLEEVVFGGTPSLPALCALENARRKNGFATKGFGQR